MDGLDDFLDTGTTPLEQTPETEAQPETIGQPRDEHGKFAPKPETGVNEPDTAVSVPPTDQLPPETFKAVREEREKRQNLERELEALKQQINAPQAAPAPSIWEDDQGALDHVKQEAVSAAVQQATFNAKLDMSEMMVRQANPDFEQVKADFLALAQHNPTLVQQALADPHPWNKAYQIAKNHQAMQALGATNVAELEAKLREQIKAEMTASQPILPTSLADSQSARVSQQGAPGMLSLDDILRR